MWKSAIKEALELAMTVTAFKWITNNLGKVVGLIYEYRFYILIWLITIGIVAILGRMIGWRDNRKRKQLEEQKMKGDIEATNQAVSEYSKSIPNIEGVEPITKERKIVASGRQKIVRGEVVRLQINKENIIEWSTRYDKIYTGTNDEKTKTRLKQLLQNQHYLEKPDFLDLCMWKSHRPKKHYESNNAGLVKELTQISFATNDEKDRIMKLRELKGVDWPVASAILHFAFPDKYPILDFRALWSLGMEKSSSYSFTFWQRYCHTTSQIAQQVNLSIRTVDKALWAYSKKNQPRLKICRRPRN